MKYLFLFVFLILNSGCGSTIARLPKLGLSSGGFGEPYIGLSSDFSALCNPKKELNGNYWLYPFVLIDTPISGVVDTVLLPIDFAAK